MAEPAIGSTLAGYRIEELIARGGMGVVYRATQVALDRPVALKVIARELADRDGFRERFLRESRLAARLEHPSVVPVYDSREVDGELVVAMRLIEGGDLKKHIEREGPLPAPQAIELLAQIADALDAAHAQGIVHRDVKPHNILLDRRGAAVRSHAAEGSAPTAMRAYLSDFGLAKAMEESGAGSGASIVGTVEYMAPEQWRGERVSPAADVYSLGCVLFEAVTGVVPYARRDSEREPQMPAGLDAVIEKAVAKDPADRFPSARALIEAARERQEATPAATRVLSPSDERPTRRIAPPKRRRWGRLPRRAWLAGAALVAAAAVAALLLLLNRGGVSVSKPIPVGRPPLRIAAGPSGIWVASERDRTVSRIDTRTMEVAGEPLRIPSGVSGIAVGAASVWVSSGAAGKLLRIDPRRDRVIASVDVGGRPGAVAVGGGRVWVADQDGAGVTAVDRHRGRLVAVKRGIVPHAAPLRLAVGAGGLWVSSASTGSVRRIDLDDVSAGEPIPAGRGPAGITVARGLVWVANSRSGVVSRVDPALHATLRDPIEVGGRPGGVAAGTSLLWVADAGEGTLRRISLDSGELVGPPVRVGGEPTAVVIGNAAVWVVDNDHGTVIRVEP